MRTLIVHLPGGDQIFADTDYQFGTPDKSGNIEIMKVDGTSHVAFYNALIEVQTSDPVPDPTNAQGVATVATNDQTPVEQAPEATA